MALSKDLEEELTCPIDLEYFEEPMQLKCLHLLCEKDVDHMLDEDELLQCPVCKRVSEKRDIKRDFRIKRLIELVKGDANKLKEQQTCDFGEEEPAFSWCRECKMYFGKQCERGHKRMAASKNHQLDYMEDIITESKEQIQKYLLELKHKASEYEQARDKWVKTKDETINAKILDKIQESEDAIINETKRVHNELRSQVRIEFSKATNKLDMQIESINSKLDLLGRKMQILRDIIETDDSKSLLKTAFIADLVDPSLMAHDKNKTQDIGLEFQNSDFSLSSREKIIIELSRLHLITKNKTNFKVEEPINIAVTLSKEAVTMPKKPSPQFPELRTDFAEMSQRVAYASPQTGTTPHMQKPSIKFTNYLSKPFGSKVVCKFDELARSILIFDNNVWIVFNSGKIGIYRETLNQNLDKIKSFVIHENVHLRKHKKKQIKYKTNKVIAFKDGTLIASCDGALSTSAEDDKAVGRVTKHVAKKLGLVNIDRNGFIKNIIAGGSYCDVCHDGQRVYGMTGSRITIHNKTDQGWCQVNSISLKSSYSRLCVVNDKIILSSLFLHKVTSCNLETYAQEQLASYGETVGEVNRPLVSCGDQDGNVLICETLNQRLQVLFSDNTWKLINVNDEAIWPCDAAVSRDGRLYVLSYSKLYVLDRI